MNRQFSSMPTMLLPIANSDNLYLLAQRFDQSKEYFKKYLDLTAGNIPAKIRYVNALFYAKDYDGVIKNVEDIFKVDKSRDIYEPYCRLFML